MTPRGIRLNNPGNIVKSQEPWVGKIPSDDYIFEAFDTPQNGINAIASLLKTYYQKHQLNTIQKLITRYSATDQVVYVNNVSLLLGVQADEVVNILKQPFLIVLIAGIIQQENGQQPYNLILLANAARRVIQGG